MHLDAEYYISKVLIPPLERFFNLVGANVRSWYEEMPKPQFKNIDDPFNIQGSDPRASRVTLRSFMKLRLCTICRLEETDDGSTKSSLFNRSRAMQSMSRQSIGIRV